MITPADIQRVTGRHDVARDRLEIEIPGWRPLPVRHHTGLPYPWAFLAAMATFCAGFAFAAWVFA